MRPSTRAIGSVERLMILRTFAGFAQLDPAQISVLARYTRTRFFAAGAVIAQEREPTTSIHFLVSGEVELHRHGHLLGRFRERDVVGGLNALARDPDTPKMVATRDTVTLQMRTDDMEDVFEDSFSIALAVTRGIARGIIDLRLGLGPDAGFVEDEAEKIECPARPFDLVERIFFLRKSMMFAQTRIEALAQLARHAEEVRLDPGTVVWREGDEPAALYFPICGRARGHSSRGHEFTFGYGSSFGGLDNLAERPHWYTAEVDEYMVALRFDREIFLDVLEDNAEMARDFLGVIAAGLLGLRERAAGHTVGRDAPATSAPAPAR